MTKKGLTLIELLAVIIIIGVILLVVIPNLISMSKKIADDNYQKSVYVLQRAAKTYLDQDYTKSLDIGSSATITIQNLVDAKLIELPFSNPKTKKNLDVTATIIITRIDYNEYDYQLPM